MAVWEPALAADWPLPELEAPELEAESEAPPLAPKEADWEPACADDWPLAAWAPACDALSEPPPSLLKVADCEPALDELRPPPDWEFEWPDESEAPFGPIEADCPNEAEWPPALKEAECDALKPKFCWGGGAYCSDPG